MAKSNQKPKVNKTGRNDDRKNGKAWKKRSCCGNRHSPERCR